MSRILILAVLFAVVSACAPTRVLVKDCRSIGQDMKNCELIDKL